MSLSDLAAEEKQMMVNIMDILYDISKTFIFHNDWELRHGALMYIRAFSRSFKKNKFTRSIPKCYITRSQLKLVCEFSILSIKKDRSEEKYSKSPI
jgi:hypothetical protein